MRDSASRIQRFFDEHTEEYIDKYLDSAIALYRKKNTFLRNYVQYDSASSLNVLDIGSGGGIWGDLFLDNYPWAQLVCLDISLAMLRKNRSRSGKNLVLASATRLPFSSSCFDLISVDTLMHHLIDYRGYSATILGITQFLRSLKPLLKPEGKVIVREIYHESIVRDDMMSHLLFFASTLRLPRFLASFPMALGISSQGVGVCFLTRRQWTSVIAQSGYRIVETKELDWNLPFSRRLAGFKASGDIFLLLSSV